MSLRLAAFVLLFGLVACEAPRTSAAVAAGAQAEPPKPQVTLSKPIGITTAGGVFTPLIPAGESLPVVRSQTFGNQTNGKSEVGVELSQKGTAGSETIASLRIDIPPAANDAVGIIVTLTVSDSKQMTVKTTVVESAKTQEFGPFAVE